MKITDRWPMLWVVVKDLQSRVERYDNYKGKPWWNPWAKVPKLPEHRICREIERGLHAYGQPWVGVTNDLCDVYIELGYEKRGYPLDDEDFLADWSARQDLGKARRKLLQELLDYIEASEFGPIPPADDQVRKILA